LPLQDFFPPPEEQDSPLAPPADANTENFFDNFDDPHFGQGVPFQVLVRMSNSLSAPHF
jgi:hypothetical protein